MTLILLLPLFLPPLPNMGSVADATDQELAGRAWAAFQAGLRLRDRGEHGLEEFSTSAGYYEELRRRGFRSSELDNSLGNACFLADDLPHAIAAYRRGLRVSPLDPTLRQCLTDAREQVIFPDNTAFGRPPMLDGTVYLPGMAANILLATTSLLYSVGLAFLTRFLMVRRGRWLLASVAGLLVAGLLTILLTRVARGIGTEDTQPLVVIAEDGVLLRKGDGLAFPPRFDTVVNRGVEARLLYEREGWVQIELAAGEVGWVPRHYVIVDRAE